jgi:hypothetical protein
MHALLVAAAEAAEHAEPSKTAFYIAGGALAAWAVILSAFGLSKPDFPTGAAAARGVMAISVVLVGAALVAAVATS